MDMPLPVNPDNSNIDHIAVSNNGVNLAIYQFRAGSITGRLFLTVEEMESIITAYRQIATSQKLQPAMDKLKLERDKLNNLKPNV